MRLNMPVSDREYVLAATDSIVSKTDLNGVITYVNADFVRISGFSEDELLGAPHNIVRHPDMPPEAFDDFWRALQSGKAWNGLVKNRTKDGDYYWVEANASPILENGQAVGYTSVRVRPDREQVQAVDAAYRRVREGDRSIAIVEGRAVARSRFRALNLLKRLSVRTQFRGATLFAASLFACVAFAGWVGDEGALGIVLMLLGGLGAIGAVLGDVYFERVVIGPLTDLAHEAESMAQGDLTRRIATSGESEIAELGHGLRVLQTNLKLLIGQIKEITAFVKTGSEEIASGSHDLSARTEEQAASLEQTASAMEELTGTVQQNADNSARANELVSEASRVAQHGGDVVGEVVATMNEITTSSRKIADIIAVIDGIAFQTNILALNAAVEAARAGEQGRGFAVVAGEVRGLSHRSAEAAKEIKGLIVDSVQKIEAGSKQVERAGTTMREIVEAVRQAASIMAEISSASREQAGGIAQVGQAVSQMDEVTQQNASLVEDAAGAAGTLTAQVGRLQQVIGGFRLA